MTDEQPRWLYRFDNYKRAFGLLREAIEIIEERDVSQLEKEGIIQRFEYTWELAWKVLRDYLTYQGVVIDTATPRATIRAAFAAHVIANGEKWMETLDARNKMFHTYDFKTFEKIIVAIQSDYLVLFDQLHETLLEKVMMDE